MVNKDSFYYLSEKGKLDKLLSNMMVNTEWYLNQLDYIKFDFIKRIDIYYILGINDFKDYYKNRNLYGFKFELNHFYGFSKIMIKGINYKLYENIFDFVFTNSHKFHFMVNEKVRGKDGKIVKDEY